MNIPAFLKPRWTKICAAVVLFSSYPAARFGLFGSARCDFPTKDEDIKETMRCSVNPFYARVDITTKYAEEGNPSYNRSKTAETRYYIRPFSLYALGECAGQIDYFNPGKSLNTFKKWESLLEKAAKAL